MLLSFFFDGWKPVISAPGNYSEKHKFSEYTKGDDSIPEIERVYIRYGLVNVRDLDCTIKVDLRYSVSDNFMGKDMYAGLKSAYLQREAAEKLVLAHKYLKTVFPHYSLVVLDASRPVSIQEKMWNETTLSSSERSHYLASPSVGSLHSYGAAVDVTIADGNGKYLDMGIPFDAFDELSYTIHEKTYEKEGKLSPQQLANRQLLRMVMKKAGYSPIETEWWHFNSVTRSQAKIKYPVLLSHVWKDNNFPHKNVNIKPRGEKENRKPDIVFKVQIKTSTKPLALTDTAFKGQTVTLYRHESLYKYTVGEFKNLDEAREMKIKLWGMGFTDAFIAAFNHDKRIGIMDAVELLNEQEQP